MDFRDRVRPKTKYRSNLDAEEDLRVQLSPIIPDLKFMCSSNSLILHTENLTTVICIVLPTDYT